MPKENLLYKLDNLEYQYHYLNNTVSDFKPRLNQTKKVYNAIGKKNAKRIKSQLESLNEEDILKQLQQVKTTIFNGKIYTVEKHLKVLISKDAKLKDEKIKSDICKVCNSIAEFIELIVISKIIKIANKKIVTDKDNVPEWFKDHDYYRANVEKDHKYNPSRIWNDAVLKIDGGVKLIGVLWNSNSKKVKEILNSFENGMDVFLNINFDKKKQVSQKKEPGMKEKMASKGSTEANGSDMEEEEHASGSFSDNEGETEIDEEAILKQYEGMLAASDDESGGDKEIGALDPDINYNEVTDEEPSEEEEEEEEEEDDEDDEDDEPSSKKPKLPELMAGYYSGDDSDSDEIEDKIAREQASNAPKRKNRRGQRARRKIWEQKYGKGAKHIQREFEKKMEEREQRQKEYEERVAKRAVKAALRDKENANLTPLGERKPRETAETKPAKVHEEHPSWVAKRIEEEKLKNAKFKGKKITFD
ncbi:hypothetical protein KAFR_0A02100 [Kazachstania africana CBS 2517]|uniref:Bud22 domain-containing protein n=1 Tax=Kazachstania africana (strain ATCC 22294 / BCRC 22015 / CBS 2517 / CECT 1963 / NBRC 1671 / NRRL Y-8276) TaxID=1071382 RepID=H2AMP8_KAZAF|nr:hypothetical protein KAFR_0A02100 [Kazachstania africana CBS 2517]CCF55648.1 hypothetical protein KAFR_0A02100 [Kazachstania africana CBS 2517]